MPRNPNNPRPAKGRSTYNVFANSIGVTLDLQRNVGHLRHFAAVLQGGRISQSVDDMERANTEITRILKQIAVVNSTLTAMILRARSES